MDYSDVSGVIGQVASQDWRLRSSVGVPVSVESRVWGCVAVAFSRPGLLPLPADTEARLASFTELVATAIANTESRASLARLAEEQAALRRVATLVAAGAPPQEAFAAVAEEAGRLFLVDVAAMIRYESDGTATYVASAGGRFAVGTRLKLEGKNASTLVYQTGRAVRTESYADASGPFGATVRERGIRSSVGTPIIVEGRLWGVLGVATSAEQPLPPDTEARLASFTELVATAIANAESRSELAASRGGSSPRRTRPGVGSSVICTTVRSSGWSRLDWRRAPRRPMSRLVGAIRELSCPASRRDWPTQRPNCRSFRAGSTR